MNIKSLIVTALMGVGTMTLAGCVDGGSPYGGSSGVYVSSYGGPYYGDGFYRDYRGGHRGDGYRRNYRRDGRNYAEYRRDNDRPRNRNFPNRGNDGGGQVILPDPGMPHSFNGRGGAP